MSVSWETVEFRSSTNTYHFTNTVNIVNTYISILIFGCNIHIPYSLYN